MTTSDSSEAKALSDLRHFMKMRVSLVDEPVVMYWVGEIFQHIEPAEATDLYPATGGYGQPMPLLFRTAAFAITRAYFDEQAPRPDGSRAPGYCTLLREIMFYQDPATGQVLETWRNNMIPLNPDGTGGVVSKDVHVLPILNNPINFAIGPEHSHFFGHVPYGDKVAYSFKALNKYANPLVGPAYERFSSGDVLQSVELLLMAVSRADLEDPTVLNCQDVQLSFTRVGPYLPWMHMGRAPGRLIYTGIGHKVRDGFTGLPSWLQELVLTKYPEYSAPPAGEFPPGGRIMNSWHVFREMLDNGKYQPTSIP